MHRTCRLLNKITNEIFYGEIDTEFEHLPAYELVEIPDNGKIYEPTGIAPYYQEVTIVEFEALKPPLLEKISGMKKVPFTVNITDINGEDGSYYVDLQDSTILKILVLVKKAEILGQASDEFINADMGIPEYKTFSLAAIQGVQAEVIAKDDFLKQKANQVKLALNIEALQGIEQEINNL